MSSLDIKYPDISEALYKAHSLDEARTIYVSMLRETGNIYNSQYAAKLENSKIMLSQSNLKQLEKDSISFKEHMRIWSKKSNIQLSILRRQKDFLGLNSKIRLYLQTGKNMSKIHDLLGFRIILKTPSVDNDQSIKHCYDALNETIRFFALERNCMLLEAEPRSGAVISSSEAQKLGLCLPEKSMVLKGFENNVKDYVLEPKKKGYQSLHILVETPSRLIFEVQVRTTAMDIIAENGPASHNLHKEAKYEGVYLGNIDFSKVNMPGFQLLSNGEIYDTIGLQKSIDPFNFLY